MKKTIIYSILVFAVFVFANSDKLVDKEKVLENRRFASEQLTEEMVHFEIDGEKFDMDVYEFPNKQDELPTGNMKYSDAVSACESVGKRLCTESEWQQACKGATVNKYAYGPKRNKDNCNNLHHEKRAARSGSFPECKTETGVYDMDGNVWEWVSPSKTGAMRAKGGSYRDGELTQRCIFSFKLFKNQEDSLSFDNFGTRCCQDAEGEQSKDTIINK